MNKNLLKLYFASVLVMFFLTGGCANRSYNISEYFVVKNIASLSKSWYSDLYVRSQEGKLDYVGSIPRGPLPAKPPHLTEYHTSLALSKDGRSIVYHHNPGFAGDRSGKDFGIYLYTYGEGERLLSAPKPYRLCSWFRGPLPNSGSPIPMPPGIVAFYKDEVKWAATAEGEMFPLVLYNSTPLHKAVFEGNQSDLLSILKRGKYINIQNYWGLTPLALATVQHDERMSIQLIEHGADPTSGYFKPLLIACYYGQWGILESMLKNGADPNTIGIEGANSLCNAIRIHTTRSSYPEFGNYGVQLPPKDQIEPQVVDGIRLLLSYGADLDQKDFWGSTAIERVMLFGDSNPKMCYEVLTLLLAKGANPNTRDAKGSTPLHQAIRRQHPMKIVKMLIDAGADANELDNEGNMPLHFIGNPTRLPRPGNGDLKEGPHGKSIWEQEYKPIVQLLISHTTNIDALNDERFSPLHFAVRGKAINTAEYLVENGADDSVRYKSLDYDSSIPSYWTQTVLGMPAWTHMLAELEGGWFSRSIRDQMNRIVQSELWITDPD